MRRDVYQRWGLVAAVTGGVWWSRTDVLVERRAAEQSDQTGVLTDGRVASKSTSAEAIRVGKELSHGKRSGSGSRQLTHPAMDPADFGFIVPYGLMVGGHVTPIDHQYYTPADMDSPRDAYGVYAMGDARLVAIQHRTGGAEDNASTRAKRTDEYRLVFSQSCTFLYYYDLVTSLSLAALVGGKPQVEVDVPVTAGELIGRIGG